MARGVAWFVSRAYPVAEYFDPETEQVLDPRQLRGAEVPCPECGAELWEVVETRAALDESYTRWRLVICGSCGAIADRASAGRRRVQAALDPEVEQWREEVRERFAEDPDTLVGRAHFAIYGLDRALVRTARLGQYSQQDGRLVDVCVEHRARIGRRTDAVRVKSSVQNRSFQLPLTEAAKYALAEELPGPADDPSWEALSAEARLLKRQHRLRHTPEPGERARQAHVERVQVPVDGAAAEFAVARDEYGLWLAIWEASRETVTITGTQFDPDALRIESIKPGTGYFTR